MSPPIPSCSPFYAAPPEYGTNAVQQNGPGEAIQWGAYPAPEYIGDHYQANVYMGGVKVDGKNQPYPPHGSVSAQRVKKYAGTKFELEIIVSEGPTVVFHLVMQCRIA